MVTKKPDDTFDGYFRALYGSYGTYAVEGAAGGPINDQFALRVAPELSMATRAGSATWTPAAFAPAEQNEAGRLTAVFRPNQEFRRYAEAGSGQQQEITGSASDTPFQWINCSSAAAPVEGHRHQQLLRLAAIARDVPMGFDNHYNSGLADQFALLKTGDAVLTMNYHLGDLTLSSVTGYYGYKFTSHEDNASAGTPVLSTNSFSPEKYHQFQPRNSA